MEYTQQDFLEQVQSLGYDLGEKVLNDHRWNKIGPYELMTTKAFSDELLAQPTFAAQKEFILHKIEEFNEVLGEYKKFYDHLGPKAMNTLKVKMNQQKNATGLLLMIANGALAGNGMNTISLKA